MKEFQTNDIGLMRLRAQGIAERQYKRPEDVVKHLLAMQAQDYSGALWSVGLRTNGCTQSDVEQAIRDRKIIRTWPMRGTLHFVHADDVHWLLALTAPRATAAARSRRINFLGLSDEIVAQAEQVLRRELKGGRSIVRNRITALLNQNIESFEVTNQHTQHLMRNFGERGIICFGPNEGKQPTFVLLDEWVGEHREITRPVALAALAKRYFISHGPATLRDFGGWAMLTVADAKLGLELAQAELDSAEINGHAYYFAPGLKALSHSETFLLPGFDEYLLGYKQRDAVLNPVHSQKVVPGGNGMFLPTIIKNGQVIGIWKRQIKKTRVDFNYSYFNPNNDRDMLGAQTEDHYRNFVGSN
ncbi:MAG: winged helix DNA-binding domain-containing protein [Candidatus Saccharibacteria bacterium]